MNTMGEIELKQWLGEELSKIEHDKCINDLPALKMEEGVIYEFEVVADKPFDNYIATDGMIKKKIPVIHLGVKKLLWLNVRNPLYGQMVKQLVAGNKMFKVVRSGKEKNTRYSMVK
jgi:hypothetical protein